MFVYEQKNENTAIDKWKRIWVDGAWEREHHYLYGEG